MIPYVIRNYTKNEFLKNVSTFMNLPVVNDRVDYCSPYLGEGFVKCIEMPSGIVVSIMDFVRTGIGLSFICEASEEKVYGLHIHDFKKSGITFTINDEPVAFETPGGIVHFISHSVSHCIHVPFAQGEGYGIHITLKESWLIDLLGPACTNGLLDKYFALKDKALGFEQLDPVYDQLLKEVFALHEDSPMYKLKVEKLVTDIITRFFTRLYEKLVVQLETKGLYANDVDLLLEAEKKLIENLASPPSIESLAAMSCMGINTFKGKFRRLFGNSVFAYFQDERLKEAHRMLTSGRYSVKETAAILGFKKPSSLITVFKKKYKILPGSVTKHGEAEVCPL